MLWTFLDFLDKTSVKAPNKQFHLALLQPYRLCCLLAISFIHVSFMSKQVIPDASCFLYTVNTPRKLVRRQAEESSHWFCSKLKFITLDGIAKVKVIVFPALVLGPDILFSFWVIFTWAATSHFSICRDYWLLLIHESYYTMCGAIKKCKTKTTGLEAYLQTSSSHWTCGEQCVFPDQLQVVIGGCWQSLWNWLLKPHTLRPRCWSVTHW